MFQWCFTWTFQSIYFASQIERLSCMHQVIYALYNNSLQLQIYQLSKFIKTHAVLDLHIADPVLHSQIWIREMYIECS